MTPRVHWGYQEKIFEGNPDCFTLLCLQITRRQINYNMSLMM